MTQPATIPKFCYPQQSHKLPSVSVSYASLLGMELLDQKAMTHFHHLTCFATVYSSQTFLFLCTKSPIATSFAFNMWYQPSVNFDMHRLFIEFLVVFHCREEFHCLVILVSTNIRTLLINHSWSPPEASAPWCVWLCVCVSLCLEFNPPISRLHSRGEKKTLCCTVFMELLPRKRSKNGSKHC